MKWLIGLDLRPGGSGALAFAKGLRDQVNDRESHDVTCVHVVEASTLLRHESVVEMEDEITAHARREMEAAGVRPEERNPRIVFGLPADTGLVEVAQDIGADAIIVGRRAGAYESRVVRLGRVARRLLRKLPVPTVIVPPDVRANGLGRGPIMLATDLTDHSAGAAAFAREMSRILDRPIVAIHIVPDSAAELSFLPAATLEQLYGQLGMQEGQNIETWLLHQGLTNASTALATGDVVDRILTIAEQEKPPLIVCGSRLLSTPARIFGSSVGSDLAAHARVAVAVVPPNFALAAASANDSQMQAAESKLSATA